ncbi:MAG: hypothetical protein P9M08_11550 [Candidatus Erginobacter occultus]|nr:hypothetical protein [Candidatus Erginobacter occultus]
MRTDRQYREETGLAETAASLRFTVFSVEEEFSRRVLNRLEEAIEKVQADLHLKRILRHRCLVFIWPERDEYLKNASSMGFSGLDMTGGFAVSAVGRLPHQLYLYRSDDLFGTVIPHELAHLLLEVSLNSSRKHLVPLWLHEGFAQTQEEKDFAPVARALSQEGEKELIPLEELAAITAYPDDYRRRELFYQQAEGLVRFLLAEETSAGEFFYLARNLVFWANDLEGAIRSRYGKKFPNLEQLEELWIRYLRNYPGGGE